MSSILFHDVRKDIELHIFPGWRYLAIYSATGALAGVTHAAIEYSWTHAPYQHVPIPSHRGVKLVPKNPPTLPTFLGSHAPALIARSAVRFFCFGQFKHIRDTKRELGTNSWPKWLDIGASGAAAGLVETVVANRIANPLSGFPPMVQLVRHPARLLCCFSTFGFLATTFSDEQPPRPFLKCWAFGATAGAVGTTICAAAEGLRGKPLWANAVPRGALGIGTLIAVQVTSCADVLSRFDT